MSSLTRRWQTENWRAPQLADASQTREQANTNSWFTRGQTRGQVNMPARPNAHTLSSAQGATGRGFGTTASNDLVLYGSTTSPTHTNPYSSPVSSYTDPRQWINVRPMAGPIGNSANYQGDVNNPNNHSANIDSSESSSLFLTRLPAGITVGRLLNAICYQLPWFNDRIYACSILPALTSQGYRHAAASITTFTRFGAERLFYLINHCPGLDFDGLTANCAWNRTLTEPPEHRVPEDHSRVLIIRAHQDHMADTLGIFSPRVTCPYRGVRYDIQDAGFWFDGDNLVLEWIFGSYRGQAANVRGLIEREMPWVDVSFGVDPCIQGPGSNWRRPGWFGTDDVLAGMVEMEAAAEEA